MDISNDRGVVDSILALPNAIAVADNNGKYDRCLVEGNGETPRVNLPSIVSQIELFEPARVPVEKSEKAHNTDACERLLTSNGTRRGRRRKISVHI